MARQLQGQSPLWTQQYGTPAYDAGFSVSKTFDGGFIVGGITTNDNNTKDILLIKLNAAGDTLWTHTYGSSYSEESFAVAQCRDSGYIIAGLKAQGNTDIYIIRTNAQGTELWNRTYGGALNEGSYSIIQTYDSGFAVCGYTASIGAGLKDMQLLKYDANGNLLWQKTYGGALDETAYALIQTADSGFVLTGTTKSYSGNGNSDIYLLKTTSTGDTLWTKTYPMPGTETAYSVTVTNGNYYLITGKTNTDSAQQVTTDYNAFALKVNTLGHVIFYQTYGSPTADECTYSVNEMPDLSYVLVGSRTESGITYPLIIKTGEWGETIDYLSSDTPSEPRNFCVVDNETIVTVGKIFYTGNWDLYLTADALCKVYYPRYIWVNNVYNAALVNDSVNILNPDSSTLYQSRLNNLVNYLATLQYSGVVITHLEDIFIDSASITLQSQLHLVNAVLHKRGIPIILNQFRANEIKRKPTVSKNNHLDYLNQSNLYNQTAPVLSRFDGLELDYEFWQKEYGKANSWDSAVVPPVFIPPFAHIYTGYQNYLTIAHAFKTAKADTANHYKLLAQWIGLVFDCDTFDVNANNTAPEAADNAALMYTFDSLQFDRNVLSFFLDDKLNDSSGYAIFKDPLTFLQRSAIGVKINHYFARLYWLGQNNYPTNVVPQFHAGTGVNGNPNLELYLSGSGTWAGTPHANNIPHYLNEVEQEFASQYFDPNIFASQNQGPTILITNTTWGTTTIMQGFEWFKYQIGPLDFDSLPARHNDKTKSMYWACASTQRLHSQTPVPVALNFQTTHNVLLRITPKPVTDIATLYIDNFTCDNPQAVTLQCYDAIGKPLNNVLVINHADATEFGIQLQLVKKIDYSGLLFIKVNYNQTCLGTLKTISISNK